MPAKDSNASTILTGAFPKALILAGIVIFVIAVFIYKDQPSNSEAPIDASPAAPIVEPAEAQLDRYMEEGKPVFAFFHSTNCQTCIVMMDTVVQVYPEFKDSVALVDVDVYDPQNEKLLGRARINAIPTLVFIDRKGKGRVSVGGMEAGQLRQQLLTLKETP